VKNLLCLGTTLKIFLDQNKRLISKWSVSYDQRTRNNSRQHFNAARFIRAQKVLTNGTEVVIGLRESDTAFADMKHGDVDMRTERLGDGPARIGSLYRTSVAISIHAE
jgi:hypothetical protein